MHAVKSRARHTAWRGSPSDPGLSFIPYANRLGRSTSSGMTSTRSTDPEAQAQAQAPQPAPLGRLSDAAHSETCINEHEPVEQSEKRQPQYKRSSTEPGRASPTYISSPQTPDPNSKTSTGTDDTLNSSTTNSDDRFSLFKKTTGNLRRRRDREDTNNSNNVAHTRSNSRFSIKSTRASGFRKHIPVGEQIRAVFWSWPNLLLFCVPIGIALHYSGKVDPLAVFIVNFLAIIPLAGTLSYATEEIAMRTGETIGGLLNATFGNATELIVAILALTKGQITIVQTSLVGSMLSNLLLVLGMCFAAGGYNRIEQHFNVTVAQTACSLLILAVGSLIIPTVFQQWSAANDADTLPNVPRLSRGTAIILLFVYGCYLVFQLRTHVDTYNAPSEKVGKSNLIRRNTLSDKAVQQGLAHAGAINVAIPGQKPMDMMVHDVRQNDAEEEEQPSLSWTGGLLTLAISTAFIGVCSECVVDSIDYVAQHNHVPLEFIGLILLPIVGNAAEHATAVTVAIKDKMDLSIGVAVGSSLQIALLVLPLTVIIGWGVGAKPNGDAKCSEGEMTLDFDGFVIAVLFVAVLLVNYLIQDGKSHWLEGVMLMTTYITIAVACWFYPDTPCVTQAITS